jgi:hypothetical protein
MCAVRTMVSHHLQPTPTSRSPTRAFDDADVSGSNYRVGSVGLNLDGSSYDSSSVNFDSPLDKVGSGDPFGFLQVIWSSIALVNSSCPVTVAHLEEIRT